MNNISTWLKVAGSLVALVITITGAIWGVETYLTPRIAHNELRAEVRVVKNDVKVIKLRSYLRRMQERVWDLEREFGVDCKNCPGKYFKEYNQLQFDIDQIRREIQKIERG